MKNGKVSELLAKAKADKNHSSITTAEKTLLSEDEARRVFERVKTGLLSLAQWNENAGISSYELFNEAGEKLKKDEFAVGDFERIWLKGSGKFDWVKVLDFFEAENEFVLTVKPAFDPTGENAEKRFTSHFFTDDATNNFCVVIDFKTVKFLVIGLDEKMNTTETENALETTRNLAVKLSTYLGIQNGEWKRFAENFVEKASRIEREKTLNKGR